MGGFSFDFGRIAELQVIEILRKSTFGGFEEFQVGNSTRTRERDGGLQPPIARLVYICEDKDLEAGFCGRILRAPIAELEILATVDEIEVLRLRGAPDP